MKEGRHSPQYASSNQAQQNVSPSRHLNSSVSGLAYGNYSYHVSGVLRAAEPNIPVGEAYGKLEHTDDLFTLGPFRHSQHFTPFDYQAGPQPNIHGQNLNANLMDSNIASSHHGLHYLNPELLSSPSSYVYGLFETQSSAPQYTSMYDPFQGSPVQITSLSSRTSAEYESPATPDPPAPPSAETSNSKLSYKDALSKSVEVPRSESPVFEPAPVVLLPSVPSMVAAEAETKRDSYKDKLLSCNKSESASPAKNATALEAKLTPQFKNTSLNNHRLLGRQAPSQGTKSRPLNINNNLSATVTTKEAGVRGKKNLNVQNDRNETVQSVRSQTEPSSIPPKGLLRSRSTSVGSKSRSASDSSDKDFVEFCTEETGLDEVTRTKEKLKEKPKVKAKEKDRTETEKSRKNSRRGQQQVQQHSSRVLARAFLPRLYRGIVWFCLWLYTLCADIVTLSFHIAAHWLSTNGAFCYEKLKQVAEVCCGYAKSGLAYVKHYCIPPLVQCWNWIRRKDKNSPIGGMSSGGLDSNIPLPTTGEEAMRRLLACKGRDPYSILGVVRDCSDEDIRRYYKKQAVLVHPDKNRQRGAEEAFKILAHAFELIGDPGRRAHYDNLVTEAKEMEAAWGELNELLSRLHAKMDEAANTIRCTNCAKRHRRIKTSRPCYAARYCKECKINHSARDGDLWAESRFMGFLCYYYACMEGAVYDITEWANCQATQLRHLTSNSHCVQYRIVPGSSQQQQQQLKRNVEPEEEEDWSESELKGIFRDLNSKRMNGFDPCSSNAGHRRRNKRK